MDNMNVTTKCMTLSPGELAKLGVELDSLAPTANAHPKNDNVAHAIETPATTSQDQKTYGIYSKGKSSNKILGNMRAQISTDESCILLDNNVSTPTKILEPEKLFYKESEENMKKSFKNNNTKRNSKIRILSNIKVQITKNELRSLLDKKKVDCTTCPTVIKNSTKNCTFDPQCNSANLKIKDATDEINNSALNVEGNDKFEKQKPQKAGENHSSNQLNSTKILEAEALVLKDLNKNSACTAQSGSAKSTIGIKKTSNNCNGKFEPQEKHNTAEEYSSIRSNLNKILETGKLVYEQQCTAKVNKASLKKNYQNKCLDIFEKDDNDISFAGYSESDMEADIKMFDEFLDETCEIDKENFDNTSTIPRKIHASTISDLEEPEGNGVPSIIDEEENLEISDGFPEKNPDVKSMSYSRKPERIDVPSIINVEESMEIFDAFPVKNSNIDLELFDEFLGETSEINKEEDNMDISNDTSDRLQKTHASTISDLREPTKINDPSIINVENMKIYNALPQKNPDVKLISGSKKPERIDVPSIINVEENMEIFNAFPMKNSDIDLELFDEFQGEISEINKEEDNLDISNDTSDTPQKTHASTISDLRHPEKIDVPSIINVRESLEISDGFPEKNPVVKIISDSRKPERMDVPSIINVEENMEIFDAFPVKSSDIDLELFDEFLGETSDINKEEDNIDISNDTYGRPQKTRASTSSDFKEPEKIDVPSIMNVEENMEIFDTFPVKNSDIDLELFDEFLGETSGINKEEDNMDISNDTSGRPQKTHASTISDLREPEKIDDPSIINVEEKRDISDRFSEKSDSRKPERIDVPSIINVEQNMEIFDAFPVENSDIDLKLFDEFLGETSEIKMEEDIDIFENTSGRPRKTHISTISDLEDPEKIEAPSVINVEENMEMLDTFAVKHSNANSELFDEFPPETNTESNTSHDIFDEENSNIYCKKLIADFQEKLENLVTKNCEGLPERAEENNINHNINDCSQNEQDPLSKYNFQFETNNGHFFKPKFNESEFEKEENSSKSSDIHDIAQILGGKVDYNILETLLNINIEIIEEDPNIDEYLDDTLENDESNKVVKSKFSESSLEKEEDLSKMSDINNVEQLSDERVEINMIDEFLDKNSKVIEEDLNIFDEYVDINPNDNIDETVENEESNKVDIDYKESKEPTTVNIYPDTCLVEETPIPIINSSKLKYWNLKRSIAKLAKVKIKTSEPFKRERKKSKNNPILELPKLKIKEKLPGRFKLNGAKQKKANSLNKSDGRKRQIDYIISSDSDSDVPLSKLLKNSGGKTETYRKSKKTNVTIDSNSMKEPDSSINQSISEAPKRKRGRPKKSVVPVVVTQHLIEIPEKIDISNSKRQMQKEKIKQGQ